MGKYISIFKDRTLDLGQTWTKKILKKHMQIEKKCVQIETNTTTSSICMRFLQLQRVELSQPP